MCCATSWVAFISSHRQSLEPDPLDFFERDVVRRPVVEFCGPGRFVCRDVSGRLKGTAVFQVNRNSCGAEAVVANAAFETRCFRAALDDAERIDTGHAFVGELTGAAAGGAK